MQLQSRKLLEDMRDAAAEIAAITRTQSLANYQSNKQLRWSVERGFEIVGEALSQLTKFDSSLADKISERRKIISFRNILIHGYSQIDPAKTWDIVQKDLPVLLRELDQLLKQ
jgi:uncharacterized protein with HEPN domain